MMSVPEPKAAFAWAPAKSQKGQKRTCISVPSAGPSRRRSWLLANRRWTGGRRLNLVKRCDQVVDKGSR